MRILSASITVQDVAKAARFYRETLQLPVEETPSRAVVTAGSSRLVLTAGGRFDGVHHLAFGIPPSDFGLAREWLAERVPLLLSGGSDVIVSSAAWSSRSLYFPGPEGIILEFIARDADAAAAPSAGPGPRVLSISEVGIGVADVLGAVAQISRELAVPVFHDLSGTFASMGSHDGLLIIVHEDRIWFPTADSRPARGPLAVDIASTADNVRIDLGQGVSVAGRQLPAGTPAAGDSATIRNLGYGTGAPRGAGS